MAKAPGKSGSDNAVARRPRATTRVKETREGHVEASEDDFLHALSVPAQFVNTTITMHRDEIIRIAFGESAVGGSRFHVAVAMTRQNARGLVESLEDLLKEDADV